MYKVSDIMQAGLHKSEPVNRDYSFSEFEIFIANWKNYESYETLRS
jgi:hypothetical protein